MRLSIVLGLLLFFGLLFTASAEPFLCGTPTLLDPTRPPSPLRPAWAAPPSRVGERLQFYTHIPDGEVEAVTRYVGEHVVIHVDRRYTHRVTDAQIRRLGEAFDTTIYPQAHRTFGSEWNPGIDLDPRVHLLIHDVEENGSAQGFGGYFSQVDEIPTAYHSNRREMIYVDVFGMLNWGQTKLFSTVAHELGHLVHWYQNGGRPEESWLEEGLASFLEWAIYGNIHWIYVDGFLGAPRLSLTTSPRFENRYGASFLLLLYLYERYGGAEVLRALASEDRLGVEGIQWVVNVQRHGPSFPQLLHEWTLANLLGGYRHLPPDKRIGVQAFPRIARFPDAWEATLQAWQPEAVLLEDLPEAFTLRVEAASAGEAFVGFAEARGGTSPQRLPLGEDGRGSWRLQAPPTRRGVLLVTFPLGGRYRVEVDPQAEGTPPSPAGYAWSNPSPPVAIPLSPFWSEAPSSPLAGLADPEGFLLTANAYERLLWHDNRLYAAGAWGLERFRVGDGPGARLLRENALAVDAAIEDMAAQGRWLYLAQGRRGVRILDTEAWWLGKPFARGRYALQVQVGGDWLYVLDLEEGLSVWSLARPQEPEEAGAYRPQATCYAFERVGRYGYLATSEGLHVLDLADPPHPRLLGKRDLTAYGLRYLTPYLFALTEEGVQAYRLANPLQPKLQFHLQTPGLPHQVVRQGDQLLVADGVGGISLYRMAMGPPTLVGRRSFGGNLVDAVIGGEHGYLADREGRLGRIDLGTLDEPQIYVSPGGPSALASDGETLWVGTRTGSVIRLGNVQAVPLVEGQDDFPDLLPTRLLRWGEGLLVGTAEGHLFAWSPGNLTLLARFETPVRDIVWTGSTCWVAAGDVFVLERAEERGLRPLATLKVPGEAVDLSVAGDVVLVAALHGGVTVFDAATRAVLARLPAQANAVAAKSPYLVIADGGHRLRVHRLEPPYSLLAEIRLSQEPIAVEMRGNRAWVLTRTALLVVDLQSARVVQQAGHFVWAEAMVIQGDRLWVADRYGLHRLRLHLPPDPSAVEDEPFRPEHPSEPVVETRPSVPNLRFWPVFPNPANPEAWFPYSLRHAAPVTIRIYDVGGHLVRKLDLGERPAGDYRTRDRAATWDGRDQTGERVGSGSYWVVFRAGMEQQIRKLVVRR